MRSHCVWGQGQTGAELHQLGGMLSDASNPAGPQWVVSSGLKSGEQVVVDGFQRLRPGAKVTPRPWAPPGQGAAAAAPASR